METIKEINADKKPTKKTDEPLVDIIVAAYNEELHLPRCIESVLNQTYKNLHLIIVDDGSDDNTWMICTKYAAENSWITAVAQANHGAGHARNTGLNHVLGKYVCPLDADDAYAEDYIETLVKHAEEADLVISGHTIIECEVDKKSPNADQKCSVRMVKPPKQITLYNGREEFPKLFDDDFWKFAHLSAGKLFKADIINEQKLRYKNLCYGEDTRFVFDYLKYCKSVLFLDYAGYKYFQYANTLSGQVSADSWQTNKDLITYCTKNFCKKHDDLWRDLVSRMTFGTLYKCCHNKALFAEVAQSIIADEDVEQIESKFFERNGFAEVQKLLTERNINELHKLIKNF